MSDSEKENVAGVDAPGTSSGGGSGGSTKTVPIGAGAADLSAILREIRESQKKLDTKFAKFQDEVKQGQEDAAAKALKRVRREKPYAYKRKGNEEQASFNEKVEDAIVAAQTELENPTMTGAVGRAMKSIEEGLALLSERRKLIKLADRSEHGWGVVAEYTADELAEDSEDEKRIFKAEKAAERKSVKRRRAAAPPRPKIRAQSSVVPVTGSTVGPLQHRRSMPISYAQAVRPPKPLGPCFVCGEMGHLKNFCTKMTDASNSKKWYPSQYGFMCVDGVDVWGSSVDTDSVGNSAGGGSKECEPAIGQEELVGSDTSDCCECVDLECCMENAVDLCGRTWEAEAVSPQPSAQAFCDSVQGRLKKRTLFWREVLKAPEPVLRTIESGYVLPLKSEPTPLVQCNQQSALNNAEFVRASVSELLTNRCVKQVAKVPYICSPISVVESSSGKKRLVINLRHLNKFLWKQKFKYEDLRTAMLLLEKGDYLFSFDLKSGYHHVDIAVVHQKYLGFAWEGSYYVFTVLPFGLSTACYMFTKLLRPLVRYWRGQGIRIVVYLDDGLGAATGELKAADVGGVVRSTLEQAGFVFNREKSIWKPTQRLQWLGFVIDMELGQIEVPHDKITKLLDLLGKTACVTRVSARQLASVVGKIISLGLAVGPISRLMTRSLYAVLESRVAWCGLLSLSDEARKELEFWSTNILEYKAQPIWHSPSAVRVVYSDASSTGYGGYIVEHGHYTAYGQWTAVEASQSSTWRELTAVWRVLQSLASKLSNNRVRWFTDNQNVARILQVGSRQLQLQEVAMMIFSLTVLYQIRLEPEWIPREKNERADYLSRIVDLDDWLLNPVIFAQLDVQWGPHTIDRFADYNNSQLCRFNSRCWNPGSEAVDAFTADWSGENNWWCPPIGLIPRVIRHAQACSAYGTLIVPCWPSAPFWPILCPTENQFAPFVTEVIQLPQQEGLFLPSVSGAVLFNGEVPNTVVYALKCEF